MISKVYEKNAKYGNDIHLIVHQEAYLSTNKGKADLVDGAAELNWNRSKHLLFVIKANVKQNSIFRLREDWGGLEETGMPTEGDITLTKEGRLLLILVTILIFYFWSHFRPL